MDDLTRSIKEAVSDGINNPESTTAGGFFDNVMERFKGRLLFTVIFGLVFLGVAAFIIIMVLFFILGAL
ncbi:MAG: hypothetical protein IAE90_05345 [Ignavibacteria bacterium]|nr:hypothetical protein [Ignavibacteria bacterium]